MKTFATLVFAGFIALVIWVFVTGKHEPKVKQLVYVEYVKQGEIILPDYVCSDTLIVMDAETLNRNLAYYEQDISWGSDCDIDSLLHCENKQGLPACMNFQQYVDFKVGEGYRLDIALHIAMVDFGRAVKDMKYMEIIED